MRMHRRAADDALRTRAYGRHRRGSAYGEMADAAGRALSRAGRDELDVYRARYVEGMNFRRASEACLMSERTFYRTLNRLLGRVEEEMEKKA